MTKKATILFTSVILIILLILIFIFNNGNTIKDENVINTIRTESNLDILVNLGNYSTSEYSDEKLLDVSMQLANKLGLLNEYSRLPQYKREVLMFDGELDVFADACFSHHILHFRDRETNEWYKAFAFNYSYGYLYDQTNYCVIYDIERHKIKAVPLYRIQNIYPIKQKYKPSEQLLERLQMYIDTYNFEEEIETGEE